MQSRIKKNLILSSILLSLALPIYSQKVTNNEIKRRVESYKADIRGPYKEIRWYCKDGTIIPPKEKCPEPGGVQRARHKEEVDALAVSNHIFLGQILATTPYKDFWDVEFNHSRLKQYQLEKFLRTSDNGWILRKAQYYRGAYQAEDEEAWGIEFYNWLLANEIAVKKNFFLVRQSVRDIPHQGDNNLTQNIRAVSKLISEEYPAFLDLRVKIHGQPDVGDIEKTQIFLDKNRSKLSPEQIKMFDQLIRDMKSQYKPIDLNSLNVHLKKLPKGAGLLTPLNQFISNYNNLKTSKEKISALSEMLFILRKDILSVSTPAGRLAVLDISVALEDILIREQSGLKMNNIYDYLENIFVLGKAAAGCGYIELWEWEKISDKITVPATDELSLKSLIAFFESGRSIVDWGTSMFFTNYSDVSELYMGFEKLAGGFIDDKIRSSILLRIGSSVTSFGDVLSEYRPNSNKVMGIPGQNYIRGLNPGYAKGELIVVDGEPAEDLDKNNIYIFNKPPADMKPVAGIATVSEGNLVSHVQLLARNLGIPNAVISMENLADLRKHSGKMVFYAVSSGGTVIIKPEEQMTSEEKKLFVTRKRSAEKIAVPIERIDLTQTVVLSLTNVSAISSGIICGPKAANLGQLKKMYPDHVVNGIVIPFGIFRQHLDQKMPDNTISYWEYLNNIFQKASLMAKENKSEKEIESFTLAELEKFRKSVSQIQLSESFITDLKLSFKNEFGQEIGKVPVFLRSDTNMEDLKDFTGAGLNLTLFNVADYDAIIQGIKEVWASPYTDRSYKWRQQFLLNPENVFPSILIIPSVDVDYSGVMITTGVPTNNTEELTIAFSRGAGGAVEGQLAETYLLNNNQTTTLLSPAREPEYKKLPVTGGTKTYFASFENPILNEDNINSIITIAERLIQDLPRIPGVETEGPFDIELGFKDDKLWLFQVRPFVENKNAAASEYLNSLNPDIRDKKMIQIEKPL